MAGSRKANLRAYFQRGLELTRTSLALEDVLGHKQRGAYYTTKRGHATAELMTIGRGGRVALVVANYRRYRKG